MNSQTVHELRVRLRSREDEGRMLDLYASSRDPRLLELLTEAFTPFALALAGRFRGTPELREDISQVARLGLVAAIERYQPDRGPFKAFAALTIRGELRHHLRDRVSSVHLPRSVQEQIVALDVALGDVTERVGGQPSVREMAAHCGMTLEDAVTALDARGARRPLSLDAPVAGEEGMTGVEMIPATDTGFEFVETRDAASKANLTARETDAVRMYYVQNMKQREIGVALGISQMQVSRVIKAALRKLLAAVQGTDAPSAGSLGAEAPMARDAA